MGHPVKKVYKAGSPGLIRALAERTLTSIRKEIRSHANSHDRTAARRKFRKASLLG